MANLVRYVNTASTAGGDGTTNDTTGATRAFASLNEAEGLNWDLTDSGGDTLTINCSGTSADTTAVTFSGWTTSAACTLTINGNNTTGKWNTSYYILDPSTIYEAIVNYTANIKFVSLQVRGGSSGNTVYSDVSSNTVIFEKCIFYDGNPVSPRGNTTYYFINCIFQNCGLEFYANAYVYSCTLYGCGLWVNETGKSVVGKNVLVQFAWEDFYVVAGSLTLTNCLSNDGYADDYGGSDNRVNQTVSFVSTTAPYDLHLASSDTAAKDYGTDTSGEGAPLNFTTDIDGQTRTGSWDIGADEYVASSGFTSGGSLKTVVIEW